MRRQDVGPSAAATSAMASRQEVGDPQINVAHACLSEVIVSWGQLIVSVTMWVQTCYLYHCSCLMIGDVTLNVEPWL